MLNPIKSIDSVNSYCNKSETEKYVQYPQFFSKITFFEFRHLRNLSFEFKHPVSVISGTNKSGKTSALMAIACSHFNFKRHNLSNGVLERATWGMLMRFTSSDVQDRDWVYSVEYREGKRVNSARGYRKHSTKKWGGVAKKESQIGRPTTGHERGGRTCILIDLHRIVPGRHLSQSYYDKARKSTPSSIENGDVVNEYLSYIFESNYSVKNLTDVADGKVYEYRNANTYSSFNTASGEDVVTSMIEDIVIAPEYSLIIIDEIELGLHPLVQRRLMDVLYIISDKEKKQFIVTSHSYAVLNSVPAEARLFIDTNNSNNKVLSGLSTYEILTRMDSEVFPVSTVYVEDDISEKIVTNAIKEINDKNKGFSRLLRVVPVGNAQCTYDYFRNRNRLRKSEKITTKAACILDGDMKFKKNNNNEFIYPAQDGLFFHFTEEPPEKMLLKMFLKVHPDKTMEYHLNSNPHCLFKKMYEKGLASSELDAFNLCFDLYRNSDDGGAHFEQLKSFLRKIAE